VAERHLQGAWNGLLGPRQRRQDTCTQSCIE
jgi:hypothetical protein